MNIFTPTLALAQAFIRSPSVQGALAGHPCDVYVAPSLSSCDHLRPAVLREKFLMSRHRLGRLAYGQPHCSQVPADVPRAEDIHERIESLRYDSLARQYREPVGVLEQLVAEADEAAMGPEVLDLEAQGLRYGHFPAIPPQRCVAALPRLVVQDDEVPDAFVFQERLAVVFLDEKGIAVPVGKEPHQFRDTGLDEMTARGLQRLQEAACEAEGHAVPAPELAAPPRGELQHLRLSECLPIQIGQQCSGSLVIAEVPTAVDVAVAGPVLQGNSPLPACLPRGGTRVGR